MTLHPSNLIDSFDVQHGQFNFNTYICVFINIFWLVNNYDNLQNQKPTTTDIEHLFLQSEVSPHHFWQIGHQLRHLFS